MGREGKGREVKDREGKGRGAVREGMGREGKEKKRREREGKGEVRYQISDEEREMKIIFSFLQLFSLYTFIFFSFLPFLSFISFHFPSSYLSYIFLPSTFPSHSCFSSLSFPYPSFLPSFTPLPTISIPSTPSYSLYPSLPPLSLIATPQILLPFSIEGPTAVCNSVLTSINTLALTPRLLPASDPQTDCHEEWVPDMHLLKGEGGRRKEEGGKGERGKGGKGCRRVRWWNKWVC